MLLSQEAEGGIYEEIWHKMAGMPTVKSNSEAQQYVLQGTHAYMTDASQLEYIMLKDCTKYSVAKELFNTGGFGFFIIILFKTTTHNVRLFRVNPFFPPMR